MSQGDSFIEEVTDEVRRDRLFALFRRWAWLAVLLVLVIVGGAAWNEWRKAQVRAEAEALGDTVIAALAAQDPTARAEALGRLQADDEARALIDLLIASQAAAAGEDSTATVALGTQAGRDDLDRRWADLAELKLLLLDAGEIPAEERIARLTPLTTGGAPYRALAREQIALAHVELGETQEAVAILQELLADGDATEGLRRRATQMIVALGGEAEPA